MTIPIQLPQIGTTGIAPRQPSIFELAAPILEAIAQQKVAQAQLQSVRALTEQRRLEAAKLAQDTQDQADAAKAFYNHVSGAATRVKPEKPAADGTPSPQGIDNTTGMLMPLPQFERSLSPQAHKLYMDMISGHNATIQQGLTGAQTQVQTLHEGAQADLTRLQAAAAARIAATDANVTRILDSYKGKLSSPQMQARLINDVMTEDPTAAEKIATTFNMGSGRFQHVISPTGESYTYDSKVGKWLPGIGNIGTRQLAPAEAQAVAKQGHDIVTRMMALLQQDKNANNWTMTAQASRNVKTHGFLGALIGTAEPALQTPAQAEYSQLGDNLLHLVPGLWPRGGQRSVYLMENLRSSFIAPGGSSPQARQSAVQTIRSIDQHFFIPLSGGKHVDMRTYPGWQEAAQDALQTGTAGTTQQPPNPSYRPENPYPQP